ncbi:flippase-like domain-containing protein, partial [Candidatus Woesearchaeota archaeon]|nr:flippase-like domain-containing protein [Candidatus Woesearchaeota archaeon]
TILKWAVATTTLWLFFFSLGAEISIVPIFFINAIATIVSLIPITISGLGIREGTAIYLYSVIGVHPTIVAGVYLLFVSLNYIMGSLIFFLVKIDKDKKIVCI